MFQILFTPLALFVIKIREKLKRRRNITEEDSRIEGNNEVERYNWISRIKKVLLTYFWAADYCLREHAQFHSFRGWAKQFEQVEFSIKNIYPICIYPGLSLLPEVIQLKCFLLERKLENLYLLNYISLISMFVLEKR